MNGDIHFTRYGVTLSEKDRLALVALLALRHLPLVPILAWLRQGRLVDVTGCLTERGTLLARELVEAAIAEETSR